MGVDCWEIYEYSLCVCRVHSVVLSIYITGALVSHHSKFL